MEKLSQKIAVVIPAFNEQDNIAQVLKEVRELGYYVIVVDDGSSDKTVDIAKATTDHLIVHRNNLGKGHSIKDGLEYARDKGFAQVILMDADGQHSPEDIAKLIEHHNKTGCDFIVGNRLNDPVGMSVVRKITNYGMSGLLSLVCRCSIPDTQCGFRFLGKKAVDTIRISTENFEIESEMLIEAARSGLRIESVPIQSIYQTEVSKINPALDTIRFISFLFKKVFFSDRKKEIS